MLVLDAQVAQCIGETNAARLQVSVGERAIGIDEGDLVGEATRDVGVDEIGHGIVGAAFAEIVVHAGLPRQPSNNRDSSRRASTPATRRREWPGVNVVFIGMIWSRTSASRS